MACDVCWRFIEFKTLLFIGTRYLTLLESKRLLAHETAEDPLTVTRTGQLQIEQKKFKKYKFELIRTLSLVGSQLNSVAASFYFFFSFTYSKEKQRARKRTGL